MQFSRRFAFRDALAIVPYLARLGITHLYVSPVLAARPGSPHGYDVIDPTALNPELGTPGEFDALVRALRSHGMGLLLDIVPNHLAAVPENPWWWDVLAHGRSSPFARFFDIDWNADVGPAGPRVVLPILATGYRVALTRKDFTVAFEDRGFVVRYARRTLPLEVASWRLIVEPRRGTPVDDPDLRALLGDMETHLAAIPPYAHTQPDRVEARRQCAQRVLDLLTSIDRRPAGRAFIQDCLNALDLDRLDALLAVQPYRLRFWRNGMAALNYRRFFDITDLVGVRVEDPDVFDATHVLIIRLVDRGLVDGLRVDHVDGLWDPEGYLQRLAARCPSAYLIVEKILASDEALPAAWPVAGTTGYDFTNAVAGVFVDAEGLDELTAGYDAWTGSPHAFDDVAAACKQRVIRELFPAELEGLMRTLTELTGADRREAESEDALVELSVRLDVYRTYITERGISAADRAALDRAASRAAAAREDLTDAIAVIHRILLHPHAGGHADFAMRWQQFTGPVMAKGVEDTALYAYTRLLALNDVGIDPSGRRTGVEAFHQRNLQIQRSWPGTLNATSTHDTKRSEDIRARLSTLSEMPQRWMRHLARWHEAAAPLKPRVRGVPVPGPNMELHIFQTLLGAWPLTEDAPGAFRERIAAYVVKAARETKLRTSWLQPDEHYERALVHFTQRLLDPQRGAGFLASFLPFARDIAQFGMLNALAQLILKMASPGAPDFYQGMELWNFSLVDPDNRRPVDVPRRAAALDELLPRIATPDTHTVDELLAAWPDGRIKLYVTACGLRLRRQYRDVFAAGAYLPLRATGVHADHVCAFARRLDQTWIVAAVPRLITRLVAPGRLPTGEAVWAGTQLRLPDDAPRRWRDALAGTDIAGQTGIPAGGIFAHCPGALLVGRAE